MCNSKRMVACMLLTCLLFSGCARGEAKAYIVMEMDSMRVLFENNADERLPIASTTKIMTCLLALESCNLNEMVTASENASGVPGTSIYLSEGETLLMEDMLYGLMLRSGNDAAVAIAEHIAGSEDAFCAMMNERACELGADAYFTTSNGLDSGGNGASARGITLIARKALSLEAFKTIVSTQKRTIPWSDHDYKRVLTNKNKLLTDYDGAIGVKTGYTKKAGRCLVFAAQRKDMTLVGCVLNCPDWFEEAKRLLNKGFDEYIMRTFFTENEIVKTISVCGQTVRIAVGENVSAPVKEGEIAAVRMEIDPIALPVYKGQKAGSVYIFSGEEEITRSELICMDTKLHPSFLSAFQRVVSRWCLL